MPHRNRNARFQTSLTDARGRHSELKPHFLRVRGPGQVPAGCSSKKHKQSEVQLGSLKGIKCTCVLDDDDGVVSDPSAPTDIRFSGTMVLRLTCNQDCVSSILTGSSNRGYHPFLLVKNKRMGLMGQKSQWGDASFANLRRRVRSPCGPPARNCVKRVSGRISN